MRRMAAAISTAPPSPAPIMSRRKSGRLIDRMFGGKVTPLVAHLAERDRLTSVDIAEIEALLKGLKQ